VTDFLEFEVELKRISIHSVKDSATGRASSVLLRVVKAAKVYAAALHIYFSHTKSSMKSGNGGVKVVLLAGFIFYS
jgi:hypothetical protein